MKSLQESILSNNIDFSGPVILNRIQEVLTDRFTSMAYRNVEEFSVENGILTMKFNNDTYTATINDEVISVLQDFHIHGIRCPNRMTLFVCPNSVITQYILSDHKSKLVVNNDRWGELKNWKVEAGTISLNAMDHSFEVSNCEFNILDKASTHNYDDMIYGGLVITGASGRFAWNHNKITGTHLILFRSLNKDNFIDGINKQITRRVHHSISVDFMVPEVLPIDVLDMLGIGEIDSNIQVVLLGPNVGKYTYIIRKKEAHSWTSYVWRQQHMRFAPFYKAYDIHA